MQSFLANKHITKWLTGKLSLTTSTGSWNGHAYGCLNIAGNTLLLMYFSWLVSECRTGVPVDPSALNFLPFTLLCPLLPSPFVRASLSTSTFADFFWWTHSTKQGILSNWQIWHSHPYKFTTTTTSIMEKHRTINYHYDLQLYKSGI